MNGTTIQLAGRDVESVAVSPQALSRLKSRIEGPLLQPGEAGWAEAVSIWNGMVAKTPGLVLQPTSTEDVVEAVGFARDLGLLISVKGGGHNIAGTSIAEHGLMLDMSRLAKVSVDAPGRRAHVGPGCLLGDVDQATQAHGLATVLGFVSKTGVAGLTLGGGWGYLARRFGWTVDNLEEVEMVCADGEIRVCSREQNDELFWAVRGGGGNFGVVTRFTFRLHPVGPTIVGGLVLWDGNLVDDVLGTYRTLTESAPLELCAAAIVRLAPPAPFIPAEWRGRPVAGMLICHTGSDPGGDLRSLRALGEPVVDLLAEKPYVAQQSMLDDTEPAGLYHYWKTEYLTELSGDFLQNFRDAGLSVTSVLSQSVIFHLAGAINDRPHDDGAVNNRDTHYIAGFAGMWTPDEDTQKHVAWVRNGWKKIAPFSSGGNYVNFQVADDDDARTKAAYGANYQRLRDLKARYDHDNLFRVNRNITPAV